MTKEEIIDYYANLLIIQYRDKPSARDFIKALAEMSILDMLANKVMNAYDIDSASGVQLDVLGKYAGVSRVGYTFDRQVTLNDQDFLTLIKLKIVMNSSEATLHEVQKMINENFLGQINVFDYEGMRISYFINSTLANSELVQVFITGGHLPRPMGVAMSSTIMFPYLDSFFGFRNYERELPNTPLNTYDDYQEGWPWISYSYTPDRIGGVEYLLAQENNFLLLQENDSGIIV